MLDAAQKRALHTALAACIERHDPSASEAIYEHMRATNQPHRAGELALLAAERAERALAFSRAAQLYGEALGMLELSGEARSSLEERRGRALMYAGRGVEAAEAFGTALQGATRQTAMRLRGLATAQLLRAGRVAQAFDALKRARDLFGLTVPSTDLRAVGMLLWRRAKLALTGWLRRYSRRDEEATQRLDMLWAVAASLSCMDHLRGSVYHAEYILLARRAGDPYRMACALGMEATVHAAENKHPLRTQSALDRGLECAGVSGEPHALSVVKGTAGVCRVLEGRFREGVRLTREAQAVIRERMFGLRARVALALACKRGDERMLQAASRDAAAIASEGLPWAAAYACLLRACVAAQLDPDDAAPLFREAEGRLDAVDMKAHAAAAGFRRGQVMRDDSVAAEATKRMQQLGIRAPERFANVLAPLF